MTWQGTSKPASILPAFSRALLGIQFFSIASFACVYCEYVLGLIRKTLKNKRGATMTHPAMVATLPSEAEAVVAKETSRLLASRLEKGGPMQLRILDDESPGGTVKLPAAAVGLLVRILEEMARGNAVTLIPVRAELTTQEAADMLSVSRPSLIQLLEEGKIEYRRVGTHRRVRFEALIKYQRRADADRRAALEELAAYDQELGI